MAVFCEEYTRHMNALARERDAAREGARAELARVNRDLDWLVQALLDGAPARTVKDRMAQLEARKEVLETQLAQGEDVKVSVHPSMADHYRERVANLREALAKEGCQAEAAEIMRTLIDKIVLTSVCRDSKEPLSITLHGDLAGILGLAAKSKRAARCERPCRGVHKIGCGGSRMNVGSSLAPLDARLLAVHLNAVRSRNSGTPHRLKST